MREVFGAEFVDGLVDGAIPVDPRPGHVWVSPPGLSQKALYFSDRALPIHIWWIFL